MKTIRLISSINETQFNLMANLAIEEGFVPRFETFKVIALDTGSWAHSIILQKEVEKS